LTKVHEEVPISGAEDKAGAQLKGILSKLMLPEAGRFRASPGLRIIAPENVKQVRRFQFSRFVSSPPGIYQQREGDARLFAEHAGIAHVAKANRRQRCSNFLELFLVRAQLRYVFAAEDSPVMA
jgi:hypothetical protein